MKKTPNAYILFRKEQYSIARSRFPNYSFTELSKYLGKKWKELTYDEKTKYYDQAEKIKKEQHVQEQK